MGDITIRELNANVSKAVARVEAGEVLNITRNGRPVAELRPKQPVRDEKWWEAYNRLLALMEKGWGASKGKATMEDRYGDAQL